MKGDMWLNVWTVWSEDSDVRCKAAAVLSVRDICQGERCYYVVLKAMSVVIVCGFSIVVLWDKVIGWPMGEAAMGYG